MTKYICQESFVSTTEPGNVPAYRASVIRVLNPDVSKNKETMLIHAAMGLAGEAGEVVDLIKKWLFQGHDRDLRKLKLELGDVRFYLEEMLMVIDSSMQEIEQMNEDKLNKRFPNGWSTEASKARADEHQNASEQAGKGDRPDGSGSQG